MPKIRSADAAGSPAFLSGGGEMAHLIAGFDWSATSLGPLSLWSDQLKAVVSVILRSNVAMATLWGENGVMIYNDRYAELAGQRHPAILGSNVREGWSEVADFNDNVIRTGLSGGTLSYRDIEMTLDRYGQPEQVWFDLDYSPILDASGKPVGVLAICIDTSAKVIAERWRSSERERQRQMFEQAPGFMAMLAGPDHVFELANADYRALVGNRDVIGLTVREAFPDLEGQMFFDLLDKVFVTGEPFIGRSVEAQLEGSAPGKVYLDLIYQPVRDPDGKVVGIFVHGIDVTDRHLAEGALRDSERRLALAQNAAGIAALEVDIESGLVMGSESLWPLWGLAPRDSAPTSLLESMIISEDSGLASTAETRRGGTADPHVEYRIRRPDTGEIRWLSRHIDFVKDEHGRPVKMFGVMQDVTDRRESEARQKMLAHELEHRIKNLLAMVSAIASRTLRNTDLDTAREAFLQRLRSMSEAHDIMDETRWRGASMEQVIKTTIAAMPADQISISGPPLSIAPRMALTLALAVNELATNAVKYGALSKPEGRVDIAWSLESANDAAGQGLVWRWLERGGPQVTEPTRRGFGSFLIERVFSAEFGGSVKVEMLPEGLVCLLMAPAPGLVEATA